MDPDQTAPEGGFKYFSGRQKNTLCDYALIGLINVSSVLIYTVRIFMKCTHVYVAQTTH